MLFIWQQEKEAAVVAVTPQLSCGSGGEGGVGGFESFPGHSQESHPAFRLLSFLGLPPIFPNSSLSILEK